MTLVTKSLSVALGISLCGVSGYLLYLLFKKDEEDDYYDTVAKAAKYKILEVKVPNDMVKNLIGRNGQNIKQIQEQSSTRIKFKDQEGSKICVIRGSNEACKLAENLIHEFLANQPILDCEDLWVPINMIGKIIGRCGERITKLRNLSGAMITIHDFEKGLNNKRISLKGTKEQIKVAKSLIEDIIDQAAETQANLDKSLAKREPRIPSKKGKGESAPKVEKISPAESMFEVYVSAMVDPSRFWVQVVGPKASQLDCLVEEMSEYYGKAENRSLHLLETVNKGDIVAAIFKFDNKWYRAEVLKIIEGQDRQAELYYLDYGDTDVLSCSELYDLRTDFLQLNFQAIECYLSRIEPAGGVWSEEAVDKFEELSHVAQWKRLSAKSSDLCAREKTRAQREGSPVPGIDLFDVDNDKDINIAEELVKQGYAVYKNTEVKSTS